MTLIRGTIRRWWDKKTANENGKKKIVEEKKLPFVERAALPLPMISKWFGLTGVPVPEPINPSDYYECIFICFEFFNR